MEKKPTSLRMLESLFECEQPYVDFPQTDSAHVNVVGWQRNRARRDEPKRHAQLEPKSVSMSPVSTQEVAQQKV